MTRWSRSPVYAPGSSTVVVGEANAGVAVSHIHARLVSLLLGGLGWLVVALLLGIAASALLARRWKRLTLGLEPEELVALVQEQEAVLHGIGEGARRRHRGHRHRRERRGAPTAADLRQARPAPGRPGVDPRVREAAAGPSDAPVMAAVGDRVLVISSRSVEHEGATSAR
ncbi:hypothetical protein NKH77_49435 [Streptomyces sp. M19]